MSKNRKPLPDYVPDGVGAAGTEIVREGLRTPLPTAQQLGLEILDFVAPEAAGFQTKHIELQLSAEEAAIVARLRVGLSEAHRQLAKGKHVESANDAVRWLIQQVLAASAG